MIRDFQDIPDLDDGRLASIRLAVSPARFERYRRPKGLDDRATLRLYVRNVRMCQAALLPLHFAEVLIRNQISELLRDRYGDRWHTSAKFLGLLPNRLKTDIEDSVRREGRKRNGDVTADQLVSAVSFGFWVFLLGWPAQKGIWGGKAPAILPNKPRNLKEGRIHDAVERMRRFRNRIMHHEPIFDKAFSDEMANVIKLIDWACVDTGWLLGQMPLHSDPGDIPRQ